MKKGTIVACTTMDGTLDFNSYKITSFSFVVDLCQFGLCHKRIINADTNFEIRERTCNRFEYFQQQKHIHNGLIFPEKYHRFINQDKSYIRKLYKWRQPFWESKKKEKILKGNILKSAIIQFPHVHPKVICGFMKPLHNSCPTHVQLFLRIRK